MTIPNNTKAWLFIISMIITVIILFITMFTIPLPAQIINKNDRWDSVAEQWGIKGHDKAMHGIRGFLNKEAWELVVPKKYKKYSILYAATFSALWELKDSYEWGAEPKDFYAECIGVALSYGFRKLPKKTRKMLILPGMALGYFLVRS